MGPNLVCYHVLASSQCFIHFTQTASKSFLGILMGFTKSLEPGYCVAESAEILVGNHKLFRLAFHFSC